MPPPPKSNYTRKFPPPPPKRRLPPPPLSSKLERPRWRGGPPICNQENLPAYEDEKAAAKFYGTNLPRFSINKMWRCDFCAKVHVHGEAPGPTGESSGKKRAKIKK